MRGPRTLRFRLFSWFVGAIVLTILTSALVAWQTRPESITVAEAALRNMSARLAGDWDDPQATRAFVGEVREVTGFDAHLVRDPHRLPPRLRRMADRGAVLVPTGPDRLLVPVMRAGTLLGALEIEGMGARRAPWAWWRFGLALSLVLVVLSGMAGGVADQLARPLERLVRAADRLGGGDLAFRIDAAESGRRWVAREVRDVAIGFNRMADRLEAMVRGQRELLGAISHELRSPLGRARIAVEIARDRLPPDGQREAGGERSAGAALDDVDKQLGAVDSILGALLDVTRAGLADLRRETLDFGEWLTACIAEEPPPPPISVSAEAGLTLAFDPALLERALHNLLVNAVAHGHPEGEPLDVRATREGSGAATAIRVVVRDRGPGFAPGFVEKAFEPFVRGDPARPRPRAGAGYGLGLAIVRRIVEAHGGRVFARNAEGGGAEVGFDLPGSPRPR